MMGRSIMDQLQWAHVNEEKLNQLKTIIHEQTITLLKSWRCEPNRAISF